MGTPSFVAERFELSIPAGVKVDREKGIVPNVRVCGPRSRNGKKYPPAVTAKAAGLYAAAVNLGHHVDWSTMRPLPVPPEHRFGRIVDPRPEAGGINGTLRFNPEHAFAKPFAWAVENDPGQFAFSPLKKVQWAERADADGDRVAESILEVASVDIVTDGGTTFNIFESFVPEAAVAGPPVAADVAAGLDTPGSWLAFLTDLFGEMKKAGIDQTTKDAITALVTSALSGDATPPADPNADPNATQTTMNCLVRMGRVGKWAAEHLDRFFAADRKGRREKWAADLIKAEQLPDHLATPLFTSLVAECFGNDVRAKELIADRRTLGGAGGGQGGGNKDTRTTGRGGAKSVKELVDGYTIG